MPELLASAGMLAAAFLGGTIVIVALVSSLSQRAFSFDAVVSFTLWCLFMWVFVSVPFIPVALFRATRRYGHGTWAVSAHGFVFAAVFLCALWCFLTPGESPDALNAAVLAALSHFMALGAPVSARLLLAVVGAFLAAVFGSEAFIWSASQRVA